MQRFKRALPALLLSALAIALGLNGPNRGSLASGEAKQVDAKKVPLSAIYSTNRQKGLKLIDRGVGDEVVRAQMEALYHVASRMGASNVFLARGDGIADAVQATREVFTRSRPVDGPVTVNRPSRSEKYWLVAHLGVSGSDSPAWVVKSAEVQGRVVRLIYGGEGTTDSQDLHPYLVWAPLGRLEPGTYGVELFHGDTHGVTLLRRVTIQNKPYSGH